MWVRRTEGHTSDQLLREPRGVNRKTEHWVATGHFTGLKSTADRTTRVATQPSRATGLALLHHIGPESGELAARGAFSAVSRVWLVGFSTSFFALGIDWGCP